MQGKLLEIDLGDEVRARNLAETERATRRLGGEAVEDEDGSSQAKKPRLGRDGKPWRSKNRRGSEDVKRDQMVEEFLRDNRCKRFTLVPFLSLGREFVAVERHSFRKLSC
jgi:hypothetical protein